MSSLNTGGAPRNRRRLALWLGFGLVGLSMGAVWATGFATFSAGANGTSAASPVVVPGSPTDPVNPLASVVTAAGTPWNVNWAGDWGSTAEKEFFQVDLTGQPGADTYNVAMLLTNGAAMSAGANLWQTLQLDVELVQAAGATCQDSDFASDSGVDRIFVFDSDDSGVYWNNADADVQSILNGIVGGGTHPYCIGIEAAAPPYSGAGTFLRDSGAVPSVYPNFVVTVNRVS